MPTPNNIDFYNTKVVIEVISRVEADKLAAALTPGSFERHPVPEGWLQFSINRDAWPRAKALLSQHNAVYIIKEYP